MKATYQLSLKTLAATAALLASLSSSHGAALIYEGFDYTVTAPDPDGGGPLTAVNGDGLAGEGPATGTSGTWSGDSRFSIASGSLSYGSLQTSGNSVQYTGTGGGGGDLGTAIPTTGLGSLSNAGLLADSSTLWFSILIDFSNNSNDEMAFTLGTDEPFTNTVKSSGSGFGIYTTSQGITQAAIYSGGAIQNGTLSGTSDFQGTTQLIVGQINWGINGSTADTLTLYSPGTDLDITGHNFSTVSFDITQSSFDTLGFWARNGDSDSYDEIRFGATLADVTPAIPEPSAALLGGFGFLALLRRRR